MDIVLWTLIALLLVSNILWGYTTHKLVNKLMSKNYYEYLQTESAFQKKPRPPKESPVSDQDLDDAAAQAMTLNSLMGI